MKRSRSRGNGVSLVNADGHIVGVDLGATAVRAAAILRTPDENGRPTISVHSLGEVPLLPGVVVDGVVQDGAAVTIALKTLWAEHDFHCRNVVVGTTNQQVVVRELSIPVMTPEQRAKALPFLAKDVVALPMEEALLDFLPLGDADPEAGTIPGLLVAAPRAAVLAAVNAVENAGLSVARVDLSSFAALRFVAHEHLAVEAVIDVGAHLTSIVVHRNGAPRVVRTVARGGQALTARLVDRAGYTLAEAEAAKAEHGIADASEAATIVREALRPLLAEIRSSLHFYSGTSGGNTPIERISLTGGGSQLPGLADELREQHRVPVEVISPVEHLERRWSGRHAKLDGTGFPGAAVSVGLAMGAAA